MYDIAVDNIIAQRFVPVMDKLQIISGTSHPQLANLIAHHLNTSVAECEIGKFANGEISLIISESIRDNDVYIIQSICNTETSTLNDSLMELLIIVDAVKRASANKITTVISYFAYSRQNKKDKARSPIPSKLIANMLEVAGVNRVITMDLNAGQIQGFFNIPLDNMYAEPLIIKYITKRTSNTKTIIVAPDTAQSKRATYIAEHMNTEVAFLNKQTNKHTLKDEIVIVGDVTDKTAVIICDIADTCETIENASVALMAKGARQIYAFASHPVLSENAVDRIMRSPITELAVTNTVPLSKEAAACPKIRSINIAPIIAEMIRRTHYGESVTASPLFAIL